MKYCNNCGAQLNDTDLSCYKCGFNFSNNANGVYTAAAQPQPMQAQTGYSANQPQTAQPQTAAPVADSKAGKITGLSIGAFILSLIGCTSIIGLVLGILDVTKKDGRKKALSFAAIIIGAVFTLISLIVIPIFIAVMAPAISEYNEKTNVSSDLELAKSIGSAIGRTQMSEAAMTYDTYTWMDVYSATSGLDWKNIEDIGSVADHGNTSTVRGCIEEKLGTNLEDLKKKVKSHHTSDIQILYRVEYGEVNVLITTTDKTGQKGDAAENYICTDPTYGLYYSYYGY